MPHWKTNRRTRKAYPLRGGLATMDSNDRMSNPRMTPAARKYISEKISLLVEEGYPQEQAVAIAHDMARRVGYKVPKKPEN